jgi:hypothetical protein
VALKVGAFLVSTDPLFGFNGRGLYITMALRYGIPAICVGRADVLAGGLFSYGANMPDTWRQAGVYVGRILKGEKPPELPVVQPTKFELGNQSQDGETTRHRRPAYVAHPRRRGDRVRQTFVQCMSPVVALFGLGGPASRCPLLGCRLNRSTQHRH